MERTAYVRHSKKTLEEEYKQNAYAPYSGSVYDLALGKWEHIAEPVFIKKGERAHKAKEAFERLMDAGRKLMDIIAKNDGLANKDLAKFTEQIEAICTKWER